MSWNLVKKHSRDVWDHPHIYNDKDKKIFNRNEVVAVFECFVESKTSLDNQILIKF